MKPLGSHNYHVYILTNKNKTVLYIGVTNHLRKRLFEHTEETIKNSFSGRYKTHYLIYFEQFQNIEHAIAREKQLKKWSRKKKEVLVNSFNSDWKFLNDTI